MRVRRAGTIVLTIGGLAMAGPGAASAADPGKEIARLQAIKRELTPTERKLDSRLAVDLHNRVKAGTAEVDITTTTPGTALVARLQALGVNVKYASPRLGAIRATVPYAKLRAIAGWSEVTRVGRAVGAITQSFVPRRSKEQRAAARETALRAAAAVVSEGDVTHGADLARARDRVSGIGTKVCALSDGVDSLARSQAAGELPAVDVLADRGGDGDEGTAMLEIVHDLAPGAALGFATAYDSPAEFADNIRALRFDADCDVLVDDILYYDESPFQDGPVAQAVNEVTADGALYFSSAGNQGNVLDATSGSYENDFRGSGRSVGKFAGEAHDFDPGPAVQLFDPLSPNSRNLPVNLFWAEPLGAATSDYDLYLVTSSGTVLDFSQDVQDGDDDPYELLGTPTTGTGYRLAVVKYAGEPRYFKLDVLNGRFMTAADGTPGWSSPGMLRGHAAAADAFATAAAPAADPYPFALEVGDPPNPGGPFPGLFTGAQAPEPYTSDGPRRVFFPQPATRPKPEITAADGVSTSVPDFEEFYGTSASAPHAAAIAALVLSGNPGATLADVRDAFYATALDLAPAGFDPRSGHGLVRADEVLAYTGATPQPLVRAQQPTVAPATGDGDAYLEAGETGTLSVPVTNVGDGTATGVSVTVTTGDPQATVTPRSRSYGDLPPQATTARDFTLALAAGYPLGKRVRLTVRVTFAGVLSPTTASFTVPTGRPGTTVRRFAYSGPPVPIPDASTLGADVKLSVTGVGYGSKLTFSIDGATCVTTTPSATVGIDHPFVADLEGTLAAPDGTTARLFSDAGGAGNNLCQVVFDDGAAALLSSAPASANPFTGTWRPEQPLAALLDGPADGVWTFHVIDDASRDTGSIRAVSLSLTGFQEG